MQVDQNDEADRRGSQGPDPGDSDSTPQPGNKLRDKLHKLAKWRIDLSSINFPEGGPEFCGGFATVSQAFLVSTSVSESRPDDSAQAGGENESGGETPKRKAVAVKKMKIANGKDKERILGLALREAGFSAELSHENVIELEGFVEDLSENRVWLVFPWAANGNLKDFVASEEWEIPERVSLITDVVRGVEYLHNRDPPIYHGDLKSANVLVNSKCRAIVTDLGSARRLAKKDPPVQPVKSERGVQPALLLKTELCEATNTVTLTGNQFTLRWAAPELLMDGEAGLWSDIWALGWIFYEVVTNSIPFGNVQKESVVVVHVVQGNLPSIHDHASMVLIRALYSLMITCWSVDPSKRPTAEECRKSMNWMPMISPDRRGAANTSISRTHSPELLIQMGEMHRGQNDYINASKFFTKALDICTETADNAGKAKALLGLAGMHRVQGNHSKAPKLYSEVAQIYADIGNREGRADALWGLAEVHRTQNKHTEAITIYSEVVQICSEIENGQLKSKALWGLANVHLARNEYSEAVQLHSKVAQISTEIGDRQGKAAALWGLADVHRLQKKFTQAAQLFAESLKIFIDIGDRDGRAWALMRLADVHRSQDQHEDALPLYEEAAGIFEEIRNSRGGALAFNGAAEARRNSNRWRRNYVQDCERCILLTGILVPRPLCILFMQRIWVD